MTAVITNAAAIIFLFFRGFDPEGAEGVELVGDDKVGGVVEGILSELPHLMQKLSESLFSALHFGQLIIANLRGAFKKPM